MQKKVISKFQEGGDTQEKILNTAAELFAMRGIKAVTLKEIAKVVGVRVASLYYYYEDKDALVQDVSAHFEKLYKEYHELVADAMEKAESLEELLEILCNGEQLAKLNVIMRFGMSMMLKEQHNRDFATKFAFNHFYEESISNVQAGFDRLIEKGLIPPSDTRTLATIFMFCTLSNNEIHLHKFTEEDVPIDDIKIYEGLKVLMAAALQQAILKADNA